MLANQTTVTNPQRLVYHFAPVGSQDPDQRMGLFILRASAGGLAAMTCVVLRLD